ncbi:polygalacturonase inhibitor precursor [Iris pallida]|uniref:Polygalacturonase inhibitor n=1 Tax=Iris pallida TaxID=29817 RepID=A0AAX6FB20_IRIPA|nr:polygalacturonase inhibitor precursor [Iris pallida]
MAYHHTQLPFVFFLLLITTLFSFPSTSSSCHTSERRALLAIKSAMGNPYVIVTWGGTSDCCEWYGVKCDSAGHVTSLHVSRYVVAGTISPAIGDLPYLTDLTFRKLTNLTGPIPSSLAKLARLTFLWLDWNDLSGPVPGFLSRLTSLDYLNLAFNHFTGSIPPSLSSLPLSFIRLDRNQLTGPIPESLANTRYSGNDSYLYLYLSHNNLTGPVPSSFASTRYQVIDLSRNKLTGDASFLLGSSLPLQRLDLSRNSFEFDLTDVGLPTDLVALDLNHNKIYGGIPKAFAAAPWQDFNVSYNRLCGEIPASERFDSYYDFFHNKCLCGPPLPTPCK